jgi:O-antigen/teichoic acid export membrane protein
MASDTPQATTSLSTRSFKAALWSLVGRGGSEALRLASSLILTRLLYPEAFGLMGTAISVMIMVQLFTDTGTRLSIIQNPRGSEPSFLNTAWMIAILRGAGLGVVMVGISWPIALFFDKPDLAPIIMFLALSPLLAGLENPAMSLVIRNMKGQRQILYDLLPQVGGIICTVSLAFIFRSIWALTIGAVLVSCMKLAASYLIEPYRPRFVWDSESGRALIHFGKFVMLNTMIGWSATNLDRFIIGKMMGMETLGIYTIGLNLGIALEMFFIQLLGNSYFPALSQVLNDKTRCTRIFMRSLSALMALAAPLLVIQALFGSQIIAMLYDNRYAAAGMVLLWVSIRGMARIISIISSSTLLAFGEPRCATIAMAWSLATLVALLPPGTHLYGLTGAMAAILTSSVVGMLVECHFIVRHLQFPGISLMVPMAQAAAVTTISLTGYALLRPWLDAPAWRAIPFMLAVLALAAMVSFVGWRLAQRLIPLSNQQAPQSR